MVEVQKKNVLRKLEGTLRKGPCQICGKEPVMTALCIYTKNWRTIMEEEKRNEG